MLRTYTCYIVIIQYKTVKLDGVNIFYRQVENMKKPTILLLHGFPSSSRMFRNLIKELADEYNIIAPDYLGFGKQ
jgi:pimeloyl-ACP methyl ester carboxylesterase